MLHIICKLRNATDSKDTEILKTFDGIVHEFFSQPGKVSRLTYRYIKVDVYKASQYSFLEKLDSILFVNLDN